MMQLTKPILQRGLHSEVVRRLGLSVLRSELKPGEVFPDEAALGSQMGVSRTVIREAMRVLAAKGLVESRPKIGTRVRQRRDWNMLDPDVLAWRYEAGPDERFFQNLTEVRRIIEPAAAGLVAVRGSDEQLASIKDWCERMEASISDDELFIDADMAFHGAILSACDNDLLEQMNSTIAFALRASRALTVQVPGSTAASLPLHWAIVEVILARDEQAAEGAMRQLLLRTATDIDFVLHATDAGEAQI